MATGESGRLWIIVKIRDYDGWKSQHCIKNITMDSVRNMNSLDKFSPSDIVLERCPQILFSLLLSQECTVVVVQ